MKIGKSFVGMLTLGGIAAVVSLAVQPAAAVVTTYTSRAAFESAATGTLTKEGFESSTVGSAFLPHSFPSGLVVDRPSGVVGVSVGRAASFEFANTTPAGANYLGFAEGLGDYTARFDLPASADAFGFDMSGYQGVSFGTGSFAARLALISGNTTVDSFSVPDATDFSAHFNGFISSVPFDRVDLTIYHLTDSVSTADYAAFDEVTFNSTNGAVPEPVTACLGAMALSGLALSLARRRA